MDQGPVDGRKTGIPCGQARRSPLRVGLLSSDEGLRREARSTGALLNIGPLGLPESGSTDIESNVDTVIVDLDDAGFTGPSVVARLSRANPSLRIIAYCRPGRGLGETVAELLRAGVTTVAIKGFDRLTEILAQTSHFDVAEPTIARVYNDVVGKSPPRVREYLLIFQETMRDGANVDSVARHYGVSRRKLSTDFAQAGWITPRSVFAWWRVLVAIDLLHEKESVASAARRVGCSPRRLRSLILRTLGMSTGLARRLGSGELNAMFLRRVSLDSTDRCATRFLSSMP